MTGGRPPSDRDDRTAARAAMERYATTGDESAFAELYDIISSRLWGYCCRRLPTECAEDVMQQTLVRMHQARGTFRTGADVFPWMYRIAYHLAIDCVRKAGRDWNLLEEYSPPINGTPRPDAVLEAQETAKDLIRAFEGLPERQRAALELVRGEGLTHKQVAETMGTSISAVKSLVNRALAAIRKATGYDDDDGKDDDRKGKSGE